MALAQPELIEDFFGVYLLICLNPRYKGRTYIGYTRDPRRRITQHNRGAAAGGAQRTSNRGPWKMVLIVHGFPNNISALRFEWAWQNPTKTVRLQHLNLRKIPRKETVYKFKLRVLSEMLRVGPWCRLPLIIRWLETEYFEEFPDERKPPDHITVAFGPVRSKNLKKRSEDPTSTFTECNLCSDYITNTQKKLTCLNANCALKCHITCLADKFLKPGEYVPVEGTCPMCTTKLKWGDLIRKMRGCKIGDEKCEVENNVSDDSIVVSDENESDGSIVINDDNSDTDDDDKYDNDKYDNYRYDNDKYDNDKDSDDKYDDKTREIIIKNIVSQKSPDNKAEYESDQSSDDNDAVNKILQKASKERRPSWLFEDL